MPELPEPGSEELPEHMGYLRQEVDEAGAPLERMAQAQDRLAEAFTDAVGPPELNPTTGHAEWTVTVTELFGEVPDRPRPHRRPEPSEKRGSLTGSAPPRGPVSRTNLTRTSLLTRTGPPPGR